MLLPNQRYPNTTRTINGTNNNVYENDVVLLCDTATSAVSLNLAEIPANFLTTYKLYVVDNSNNALVNNITINAPAGYKINNQDFITINVNNGRAIITISGENNYTATLNYGTGGIANVAIKYNGTTITPTVSSINFTGSYVNATTVGNDVTVTIQPTLISVTYAQLTTLINTNALIPAQSYLITDAIYLNTAPIETTSIVLEAISTNKLAIQGSGFFLNADYQNVGDYSSVTGFAGQLGVWTPSLTPVVNNVCIWDNIHWVNVSGANGSQPSDVSTDWTALAKTNTNGYVLVCDTIEYKVSSNQIISRKDNQQNIVQNNINSYSLPSFFEAFKYFQWGNINCNYNNVSGESCFYCCNSIDSIFSNLINEFSIFKFQGLIQNVINANVLTKNCIVFVSSKTGDFSINTLSNFALNSTIVASGAFANNSIDAKGCQVTIDTGNGQIQNNTIIGDKDQTQIQITIQSTGEVSSNNFEYSQINIQTSGQVIENNVIDASFTIVNVGSQVAKNNITSLSVLSVMGGAGSCNYNNLESNSYLFCMLNNGTISGNILSAGGILVDTENTNTGNISLNRCMQYAGIECSTNSSFITDNIISQESGASIETNNAEFTKNQLDKGSKLTSSINNAPIRQNQFSKTVITVANNNSVYGIETNQTLNSQINITDCNNFFLSNTINGSTIEINTLTESFQGNNIDFSYLKFNNCLLIGGNNFKQVNIYNFSASDATDMQPKGAITYNQIFNSNIYTPLLNDIINQNVINASTLAFNTSLGSAIEKVNIEGAGLTIDSLTTGIDGGIYAKGVATISYNINMADPTIYNAGTTTLTLPTGYVNFFGVLSLIGSNGTTISKVVNTPEKTPMTLIPNEVGTCTINSTAIGISIADEIVSSHGTAVIPLVTSSVQSDNITIQSSNARTVLKNIEQII